MPDEQLIGVGEIFKRHGITRGQVFRLMKSGDWPKEVAHLDHGRVWKADEVELAVDVLKRSGRITEDGRLIPRKFLVEASA